MSEKDFKDTAANIDDNDETSSFNELDDAGVKKENAVRVEPVKIESHESQNIPPHIKIDCDIAEESVYPGCGCALIVCGFLLFNFEWAPMFYLGLIALIIGAAGILSKFFIDNYYVIDTAERKVYYRRKVFFKTSVEAFRDAGDVYAITVTGCLRRGKTSHWWEYCVTLIDLNGEKHDFGFSAREEKFESLAKTARGIAAVLKCGFIEPEKERELFLIKNKDNIEAYHTKQS